MSNQQMDAAVPETDHSGSSNVTVNGYGVLSENGTIDGNGLTTSVATAGLPLAVPQPQSMSAGENPTRPAQSQWPN